LIRFIVTDYTVSTLFSLMYFFLFNQHVFHTSGVYSDVNSMPYFYGICTTNITLKSELYTSTPNISKTTAIFVTT
jgi:hypothetical protein